MEEETQMENIEEETQMEEQEEPKNTKMVFLVLLIIIAVIVSGYFIFRRTDEITVVEEEDEIEEQVEVIEMERAHLFRAGTDGEPGRRNEGEAIEVFDLGDLLGVSARYGGEQEIRVSATLIDENGEELSTNFFSPVRIVDGGNFSMCCGQVPDEAGTYHIELSVDGEEVETLTFEVQ